MGGGFPDLAARVERRVIDWYRELPADSITLHRDRVQYAKALLAAGQYSMADSIVSMVVAEYPGHIGFLGYQGVIAARRGDEERARQILAELEEWPREHLFGNNRGWMARITAVLGDRDRAVAPASPFSRGGLRGSVEDVASQVFVGAGLCARSDRVRRCEGGRRDPPLQRQEPVCILLDTP